MPEYAIVREGEYATLAHEGRPHFAPHRNYNIDGVDYVVVSSSPSPYVPQVILVKLKEIK